MEPSPESTLQTILNSNPELFIVVACSIFCGLLFLMHTPTLLRAYRIKRLALQHGFSYERRWRFLENRQMMSLDNNKKTQKTTKYNNEVFQHLEEDNVITGHLYDREVSIADVRKVGVEYDEETGRSFSLRRTIVHVNDASYVLQGGFMGYASISCIEQALEDIGRGKEPKGTFKKKIDTRSPFVSLLLILFFVLPIVFILLFNVYLFTRSF